MFTGDGAQPVNVSLALLGVLVGSGKKNRRAHFVAKILWVGREAGSCGWAGRLDPVGGEGGWILWMGREAGSCGRGGRLDPVGGEFAVTCKLGDEMR